MALGTAPRRVSPGIWKTASGRMLPADSAAYWEHHFLQGRTDGRGHITAAPIPTRAAASQAQAQAAATRQTVRGLGQTLQSAFPQNVPYSTAQRRARIQAQLNVIHPRGGGALEHAAGQAARATAGTIGNIGMGLAQKAGLGQFAPGQAWHPPRQRSVGPVPASVAEPLALTGGVAKRGAHAASVAGLGPSLTSRIEGGHAGGLGLGLDIALLPANFLAPVRAARAAIVGGKEVALGRGVASAVEAGGRAYHGPGLASQAARRFLTVGEKSQQFTTARSPITKFVERQADIFSAKHPTLPYVGSEARVSKGAGRAELAQQHRDEAAVDAAAHGLPKRNSDADMAHYYFAHLPEDQRTTEGLGHLRQGLQRELDRTMRGQPLPRPPLEPGPALVASRKRTARLQSIYDKATEHVQQGVPQGKRGRGERYTAYQRKRLGDLGAQSGDSVALRERLRPMEASLRRMIALHNEPVVDQLAVRAEHNRILRTGNVAKKALDQFTEKIGGSEASVPGLRGLKDRIDRMTEEINAGRGVTPEHITDLRAQVNDLRNQLREAEKPRGIQVEGERPYAIGPKGEKYDPIGTQRRDRIGAALSVEKDRLASLEARHAKRAAAGPSKEDIAALPSQARNLATHVAALDRLIANGHQADPAVMDILKEFDRLHTKTLRDAGFLEHVDRPARRAIVSNWLGLKPGGETYIGHRAGRVPGSGGFFGRVGLGRRAAPEGALNPNELRLFRTGGAVPSTHVAVEDLKAALHYRAGLRHRNDLTEMSSEFPGHLPAKHMLLNPNGQVVPPGMKTDLLSQLADKPEELANAVKQMTTGYLGDESNWRALVKHAQDTGQYDDLRVIHEDIVKRYQDQFMSAGPRGKIGKGWDRVMDMTAWSLVFGRLGYVPKNILQNLIVSLPHQGVYAPINIKRAMTLAFGQRGEGASLADKELWTRLVNETGGGVSGSLSQETFSKFIRAPANKMTAIADQPYRVAAFLHEAAAEGVISKVSLNLSEADKQALDHLLTSEDPAVKAQLNDISQRSKDAMGDFDRLNPAQRRVLRRGLMVPGWLVAGTRYPIHFAATHPGRSAALAYAAAGEPGANKLGLPQNKPIDEYLRKGMPSFVQGIPVAGRLMRVQSVLPASIPADMTLAALQGSPIPKVTGYVNPALPALWGAGSSTYQTLSGESKSTSFMDALKSSALQLAPDVAAAANLVRPGTLPSKAYPTGKGWGSWGGRAEVLAREAGVAPVKPDWAELQRQQYSERGMTRSLRALKDQQDFLGQLKSAGYKPNASLLKAYKIKLTQANRVDRIHSTGLSYQKKAFAMDVAYAVQLGIIDKADAAARIASAKDATEKQISNARSGMKRKWFGGDQIATARDELKQAQGG